VLKSVGKSVGRLRPLRSRSDATGVVANDTLEHVVLGTLYVTSKYMGGLIRTKLVHHGPQKTCHFYFFNSFVKRWPILIIFGM